jgi:outer membrane protein OmpA-like peptidoglycan-associated protein
MAYASPSQVRAPYAASHPGVGGETAAARPAPAMTLPPPPRDAFREKAERKAKQKAEKEARRKGVAPAAAAAATPVAAAKPRLAPGPVEAAAPLPVQRPRPKLTVHVNPLAAPRPAAPAASAFSPLIFASTTTTPPPPKPTVVQAPPADPPKPPPAPRGGGGGGGNGGSPPANVEKEKVVDRDLLMGGLISTALLLFLGWNMFGAKGSAPKPVASPEPVLKVASAPAAPAPDPFPSTAPVELRPQEPLPTAEPTKEAVIPAAPEVKTAQAPPVKPVPAVSACDRVKMVQAYFCTASSRLTPDMRSVLEKQLTDWKACLGGEALVVKGYADARGGQELNASLSSRRAATMRDFLKSHDVKVSEAKGEGVLPGQAAQDCQNQRRVDVSIGESAPSAECAPPKDAPLPGCG